MLWMLWMLDQAGTLITPGRQTTRRWRKEMCLPDNFSLCVVFVSPLYLNNRRCTRGWDGARGGASQRGNIGYSIISGSVMFLPWKALPRLTFDLLVAGLQRGELQLFTTVERSLLPEVLQVSRRWQCGNYLSMGRLPEIPEAFVILLQWQF